MCSHWDRQNVITLTKQLIWNLDNLSQFDYIKRMITLSLITLSGFHCSYFFRRKSCCLGIT
jgi:hypothetical protein